MEPSRLSRKLNTVDAIFIGLGSMVGAGIFAALAPAAEAAQAGLVFGLFIAAMVAFFNASSSAQLARLYPSSGGTYVFARERLGNFWSWMAGWGFVIGKFASCAAVALTFGYYVVPGLAQYLAVIVIIAFTILNYFGIEKTAYATKVIVLVVMVSLSAIAVIMLGGRIDPGNLQPLYGSNGIYGIFQSAGIWFFAFAGYSRIATLAEEVEDPKRTIPRAILVSLSIALFAYALVVISALLLVGPIVLSQSQAPLITAVSESGFGTWQWIVVLGASVATLGVLLSLMTGISRMLFAMAANREMPSYLAKIHPYHRVPHLSEVTVGIVLISIVLLVDVRSAIGFSSFTVLLYYAITNMSACTLRAEERLYGRKVAVLGLLGCLLLTFSLPISSVMGGGIAMLLGVAVYLLGIRSPRRSNRRPGYDHP